MGISGSNEPSNSTPSKSSQPPPITTTNRPRDLSEQELQNLTRDQLINAYEVRFDCRVTSRSTSKLALIIAYKKALATQVSVAPAAPAPPKPTTTRPRARPLITTEFTITRNPSTRALQGLKPDPAVIVRSLQTAIRQAYQGSNPSVSLLSGRWSSQLSSNFVLIFAGQPSNDEIFRLRDTLLRPFQPGASLLLQRGFTRIILHSIPVVRTNGDVPSSDELLAELRSNQVCQGLFLVAPPKWIRTTIEPEKTHSSVIFSIIDKSGAALERIIKNPPFLFGAQSVANLFNSLPLARQCDRCHRLGHSVDRCRFSKTSVICPTCGGSHHPEDHIFNCPTFNNHTGMFCNCPPRCLNCRGAKLPDAGHLACDLSCPLRKQFRRQDTRIGVASDKDFSRLMTVDKPIPPTHIPSSQPGDDDIVTSAPRSPARADGVGPSVFSIPTDKPVPAVLRPFLAEREKWMRIDFESLTLRELQNLPQFAQAAAITRDINVANIIRHKSNLLANEQAKSPDNA